MQQGSLEIVSTLRRLASAIEENQPLMLSFAGETATIPVNAPILVDYVTNGVSRELLIRVKCDVDENAPELIHRHSYQVEDALGRVYEVMIFGERKANIWEGWIEFVSLNPELPSRRTARETTQPDREALQYWATGLEPLYLVGAFERTI